jgi:hypothetical protein
MLVFETSVVVVSTLRLNFCQNVEACRTHMLNEKLIQNYDCKT